MFFSAEELSEIESAIEAAEKRTSGEIRVHVVSDTNSQSLETFAQEVFLELKMTETLFRNGVLILLAIKQQDFVIIGDTGINEKVGDSYWKDLKEVTEKLFQENLFTEGIIYAVRNVGKSLASYFPASENEENELPNEVTFGE